MAIQLLRASTQRVNLIANIDTFQNQTEGTLCCWVNVIDRSIEEHVVAFSTGASDTSARMYLTLNTSGGVGTMRFQATSRRLDADGPQVIVDPNNSAFGVWHHVAQVCNWSGQSQVLYVDGVSVASAAPAGWTGATSNTASRQASINGLANGGGNFGNFTIQDVRSYRRALTAQEIAHMYRAKGGDRIRRSVYNRWTLDNGIIGATAGGGSVRDYGPAARTADGVNNPTWAGALLRKSPAHNGSR